MRLEDIIKSILDKHVSMTNITYKITLCTLIDFEFNKNGKNRKLFTLVRPVNKDEWFLTKIYSTNLNETIVILALDIIKDLNKNKV